MLFKHADTGSEKRKRLNLPRTESVCVVILNATVQTKE